MNDTIAMEWEKKNKEILNAYVQSNVDEGARLLYQQFKIPVRAYCSRKSAWLRYYLTERDFEDEIEERTQQTLIRVHNRLSLPGGAQHILDSDKSLSSRVFLTASSACSSASRADNVYDSKLKLYQQTVNPENSTSVDKIRHTEKEASAPDQPLGLGLDPIDLKQETLQACLKKLEHKSPELYRTLVCWCVLDTHQDVAAQLDLNPATVRQRIHRAQAWIKACVHGER